MKRTMAGTAGVGKSTTGGQYSFAQVPSVSQQRSVFDRSCGIKTTFDAGWLIPIFVDECLPGDTMSMSIVTQSRIATLIRPIMDNIYIETFWFSVPNRLLWDNWEKFQGAQDSPGDSISFTIPIVDSGAGHAEDSLYDYMGIPPGIPNLETNALFTRGYNLIFQEWFRDQNLQNKVVIDKDNGPDTVGDYVLLKRGKRHDYLTSCLPAPQRGAAISLPLGSTAPVIPTGDGIPTFDNRNLTDKFIGTAVSDGDIILETTPDASGTGELSWNTTKLVADLSTATSATINAIRLAFQTQKILERDARGGTRYIEQIKSHFGVTSPDFRHQRPEYLGGSKQIMGVSPVAQTSRSDGPSFSYLGELSAFGVTMHGQHLFTYSATEHCIIIGLVSARADLNYQQGLERQWSRSTRYDFYIPALANIGEQAVLNKEIWADGSANDELVFGYQERWAEYRYKPSLVTANFRSNSTLPLDVWHLSQDFATLPVLDSTFIQENPPIDRIIAISSEPHFIFDAFMSFKHARPMPTFSVPGQIDHF